MVLTVLGAFDIVLNNIFVLYFTWCREGMQKQFRYFISESVAGTSKNVLIVNEDSIIVLWFIWTWNIDCSFRFERQPSVPGSPFHASDSGPPSGNFPSFTDLGGADDIFTTSLCVSDADRRFDAWIPSDATRHILITMATSPPGTFTPAVEQLSSPGVLNSEPQVNSVLPRLCPKEEISVIASFPQLQLPSIELHVYHII